MYKIEYDIKLNETGRPCIDLPNDYENKPEDRFLAIELARYILQDLQLRKTSALSSDTVEKLDTSINFLGQLGDEVAAILWEGMILAGEMATILNNKYHIQVKNIENRDKLGKNIFYEGKVFKRQDGLKVLVTDEMKIYELNGGITNDYWTEVKHES
jgi:hypothetical protein